MKGILFIPIACLLLAQLLRAEEKPALKDQVTLDFTFKELGLTEQMDCNFARYSGKHEAPSWNGPDGKNPWILNLDAEVEGWTKTEILVSIRLEVPVKNPEKNRFDYEELKAVVKVPKNGKTTHSFGHGITVALASVTNQPDKVGPATVGKPAAPKPSLELVIRCEAKDLKVGDPIPIIFQIKNTGAVAYTYTNCGEFFSPEFALAAFDAGGKAVPNPFANRPSFGSFPSQSLALEPGSTFEKTIFLNGRAFPLGKGSYTVTGAYSTPGGPIQSKPITIALAERPEKEMDAYLQQLQAELEKSAGQQERNQVLQKLVFTGDKKITPILLEASYPKEKSSPWIQEAFLYYLPRDRDITQAILKTAGEKGLAQWMFWTLKERGASAAEIKSIIAASLAPEHPDAWAEGALAAQQYGDDRFAARLVILAENPASKAQDQAIYALALHRNEQALACLRRLLDSPVPRIRQTVAAALRTAYRYRGNSQGRPLLPTDFPEGSSAP